MGVDQLVIPEDQLGPLSGQAAQVTFTQRFDVVNGEGRTMRAVMADPGLADRMAGHGRPCAQRVPGRRGPLGVVLRSTEHAARRSARGATATCPCPRPPTTHCSQAVSRPSVDAGIEQGGHQIVAAVTLDGLFDTTDPATTSSRGSPVLVRPYTADAPVPIDELLVDVRAARARIDSFATMVASSDLGRARIPPLDRQVLIAESAGLDDDTRSAYLDGVGTTIDGQLAGIVTPADQRVTLTDRSGDIPLTIENQLDYPVDVKVLLTSAKLEFPEGNTRTVTLPPATPTQVDVAVEAKASGAFPLDVSVQSPDGTVPLGTARYTVRSTAISGVGLFLSIGAGAFLLLWWARHWRSIRRDRRLVSTAHPSMRSAPDARNEPAPADS